MGIFVKLPFPFIIINPSVILKTSSKVISRERLVVFKTLLQKNLTKFLNILLIKEMMLNKVAK
jgi:hypothetical protein